MIPHCPIRTHSNTFGRPASDWPSGHWLSHRERSAFFHHNSAASWPRPQNVSTESLDLEERPRLDVARDASLAWECSTQSVSERTFVIPTSWRNVTCAVSSSAASDQSETKAILRQARLNKSPSAEPSGLSQQPQPFTTRGLLRLQRVMKDPQLLHGCITQPSPPACHLTLLGSENEGCGQRPLSRPI